MPYIRNGTVTPGISKTARETPLRQLNIGKAVRFVNGLFMNLSLTILTVWRQAFSFAKCCRSMGNTAPPPRREAWGRGQAPAFAVKGAAGVTSSKQSARPRPRTWGALDLRCSPSRTASVQVWGATSSGGATRSSTDHGIALRFPTVSVQVFGSSTHGEHYAMRRASMNRTPKVVVPRTVTGVRTTPQDEAPPRGKSELRANDTPSTGEPPPITQTSPNRPPHTQSPIIYIMFVSDGHVEVSTSVFFN